MKKNIIIAVITVIATIALIPTCSSCGGETNDQDTTITKEVSANQPINLTVFIDLSDRIVKTRDGLRQDEKDLAVLNTIASYVANKAQGKIKYAKDCMKVMFYPAPMDSDINKRAQELEVDFGSYAKKDMVDKLQRADNLVSDFNKGLQVIYNNAIKQQNFTGSDIWGFFSSKVNDFCVKDGYRNVLVILTDGYIYDENHMIQQEGQANFISKGTLAQSITLMPTGQKVENLEVLVLEVNADPVGDYAKINSTISQWLDGMGIKTHKIAETDLPANTKVLIENFLGK